MGRKSELTETPVRDSVHETPQKKVYIRYLLLLFCWHFCCFLSYGISIQAASTFL